jgi:hypothetical protein
MGVASWPRRARDPLITFGKHRPIRPTFTQIVRNSRIHGTITGSGPAALHVASELLIRPSSAEGCLVGRLVGGGA